VRVADEHPVYGGGLAAGVTVGSRVAGYRLERQIGAGGMAVVYLARDERLGRPVALKVMTPAMAADEKFRRRFIRESRAASAVDDPHIIPVYEAGEADGVLFIAIRFVSGGDVGSLLRREGPLPAARVVTIVSPVASALDAAHAAGLVHRDVKPGNMLLDSRPGRPDHVYLSDFGLSQDRQSSRLTRSGYFLGTAHYVAPEQITGQFVDGRADQYALACAAFELLTGDVPFAACEGWAVFSAHMNNPPPALTDHRPDLPPAADQVLAKAMAKSPDDRYESCRQFADALRDALGLVPQHPGPLAAPTRADARPRRPPLRRRYVLAALAATAVLAAAAVTASILVKPGGPGGHTASLRLYVPIRAFTVPRSPGAGPFVSSVAFSPGGQTLATGLVPQKLFDFGIASSGKTYLWNVRTGRRLATMASGGPEAFSPDGKTLATAGSLGNTRLFLWDTVTRSETSVPDAEQDSPIRNTAFSADGKVLAASLGSGAVSLWSTPPWQALRILAGPGTAAATSVAFTPVGTDLVTGENDDRVFVWNWATGARIAALKCPGITPITSVAVSKNGATIAASEQSGQTCLWDAATGRRTATLADPRSTGVDAVAFSPDGKMLATGDSNGRTYLWNLPAGTLAATLVSPRGQVTSKPLGGTPAGISSVAFSPDGKTLATSDTIGSAYLWRVR
jgi:Tol biopolymer transport system component